MEEKIAAFRAHVTELAANPDFVHHKWFVEWHLKLVERIAMELCDHYPKVDRNLLTVMAWLHDYGKMLDFDRQYERDLLDKGRDELIKLGFDQAFANQAADYVALGDKKTDIDLRQAPIEVQILSSSDGGAHLIGPFFELHWYENPELSVEELLERSVNKLNKDWDKKIVLPEARKAFEPLRTAALIRSGVLPDRFIDGN